MGEKKLDDKYQFYTFGDVSELTRYSVRHLERLAREKKLKTVKINGRRLVKKTALEEFLQSSLEDGNLDF